MNKLLQVFLKGSNGAVGYVHPAHECEEIVRKWRSREYQIKGQSTVGGTTVDGVPWAADLDSIAMLCVVPCQQQAQPPGPARGWFPGSSGVN